jgi:hypothetical protein
MSSAAFVMHVILRHSPHPGGGLAIHCALVHGIRVDEFSQTEILCRVASPRIAQVVAGFITNWKFAKPPRCGGLENKMRFPGGLGV